MSSEEHDLINKVNRLRIEMMVRLKESEQAQIAYKEALMTLTKSRSKLIKGQKITLPDGDHYIFDRIDWIDWGDYDALEPYIFGTVLTRDNHRSTFGTEPLITADAYFNSNTPTSPLGEVVAVSF